MICQRLTDAGIQPLASGASGKLTTGSQDIYVQDTDLDRARAVLKDAEAVSDQELTELSQDATRQTDPSSEA